MDGSSLSVSGGDSGARTRSLRLAKPALSQLSYIPGADASMRLDCRPGALVGLGGLEPPTSRLSGVRSNQLSYRPTPRNGREESEPSVSELVPKSPPSQRFRLMWNRAWLCIGGTNRARPAKADQARSQPQAPEKRENSARTEKTREERPGIKPSANRWSGLPRKEVIQPHLPVRLPCYDLAPITGLTLGAYPLTVGTATSGATNFRGLTGGVYKARERIHRCLLISDY